MAHLVANGGKNVSDCDGPRLCCSIPSAHLGLPICLPAICATKAPPDFSGGAFWNARSLERGLVAVVLGLVGAFNRDAEIFALLRGQLGELDADLLEVKTRDFFVELFGQDVDAGLV